MKWLRRKVGSILMRLMLAIVPGDDQATFVALLQLARAVAKDIQRQPADKFWSIK